MCGRVVATSGELCSTVYMFFFQAEDGIRDLVRSRGLGDVYKRQLLVEVVWHTGKAPNDVEGQIDGVEFDMSEGMNQRLSLIHI